MSDITLNSAPALEESAAKSLKKKPFQEKWSPRKTLSFTLTASALLWTVIFVTVSQLF